MTTKLTSKGQVTIPKRIRDELQLLPGAPVQFSVIPAGEVVLHRARTVKGKGHFQPDSAPGPVTTNYTVTLSQVAVADLRRLQDFAIERELASETPEWTAPQRALDALHEGMRLLSWSSYSCRRAELGHGRSRELIVPFGARAIDLFEIVGDEVVVGAVRHHREEDYRH